MAFAHAPDCIPRPRPQDRQEVGEGSRRTIAGHSILRLYACCSFSSTLRMKRPFQMPPALQRRNL
jgi:hypothetical protein